MAQDVTPDQDVAIVVGNTEVSDAAPFPVKLQSGGSGGGGPATVADGADVAEGATGDGAVVTDAAGTVSGKLRGLVKILAAVADIVNGFLKVSLVPAASGGSSIYRNLDMGTTGQVVKNGAGQLYNYFLYNAAATVRFFKFYDKATAPTNSDTPVMTLAIPAGAAANVAFPNGLAFTTGISMRASTALADNDNTAPTANDCVVNLGYK